MTRVQFVENFLQLFALEQGYVKHVLPETYKIMMVGI